MDVEANNANSTICQTNRCLQILDLDPDLDDLLLSRFSGFGS